MASKNMRRRYFKNICVHLLKVELYLSVLLICITIILQAYNMISPPTVSAEIPSIIGVASLPFQINSETIFPFLMLPLLFLVVGAMLLQSYFTHNGFGFSDRIPTFDKHPHTRLNKTACKAFLIISSVISIALCCACSMLHGLTTPWYGLIVVSSTGYLHNKCSQMLRHRRRQYLHNKQKSKGAS